MEYFLAVAGLIWIFCGALVLGLSATGTPGLIACLAFSFGVMFIGLSALLGQLRTLSAVSRSAVSSESPPPVPLDHSISIEEAITSARDAARIAARPAWMQAFDPNRNTVIVNNNAGSVAHHHFAYQGPSYPAAPSHAEAPSYPAASSYPAPAEYFRPAALPPPTELVELDGEYYARQTSEEISALRRLQQIFQDRA
jgi:hypothetical protein